eukprot:3937258-Rhodomonas_salina.1
MNKDIIQLTGGSRTTSPSRLAGEPGGASEWRESLVLVQRAGSQVVCCRALDRGGRARRQDRREGIAGAARRRVRCPAAGG